MLQRMQRQQTGSLCLQRRAMQRGLQETQGRNKVPCLCKTREGRPQFTKGWISRGLEAGEAFQGHLNANLSSTPTQTRLPSDPLLLRSRGYRCAGTHAASSTIRPAGQPEGPPGCCQGMSAIGRPRHRSGNLDDSPLGFDGAKLINGLPVDLVSG